MKLSMDEGPLQVVAFRPDPPRVRIQGGAKIVHRGSPTTATN